MARKLRIQYPGAIYHVMNRGDHQEVIFCDDDDRKLWMATLAEGCEKTAFQIHSFCLMSNHFHLVVETPKRQFGGRNEMVAGGLILLYRNTHAGFDSLQSAQPDLNL